MFRLTSGSSAGYIRVSDYLFNPELVKGFEEIVRRFENETEVMLLDQIDNNGGSMFQMYALLSSLSDRPLIPPKHQVMIWEDHAAVAADIVADADAGEAVAPGERPSAELVAYSRFLLSEKAEGRGENGKYTNPVFLDGVSEIPPASNPYTKPIVVLSNVGTFSAGEFLAAILQDNKRATLVGETTSAGGGCARPVRGSAIEESNARLNMSMTLPWTLAWRSNGMAIENIGVLPDFVCKRTVEDLRSGYAGFRSRLVSLIDLVRTGRSPVEEFDVPDYIPRNERYLFREAIMGASEGNCDTTAFYLRQVIRQFARRVTGEVGWHYVDVVERYTETLPETLRQNMPSFSEWDEKLLELIRLQRFDEQVCEEARKAIEKHFELRKAFKMSEPMSVAEI
jgi:hypothetical protein